MDINRVKWIESCLSIVYHVIQQTQAGRKKAEGLISRQGQQFMPPGLGCTNKQYFQISIGSVQGQVG